MDSLGLTFLCVVQFRAKIKFQLFGACLKFPIWGVSETLITSMKGGHSPPQEKSDGFVCTPCISVDSLDFYRDHRFALVFYEVVFDICLNYDFQENELQ